MRANADREDLFRRALAARQLLRDLQSVNPSLSYAPHEDGQLQFHESGHTIRGLFPGNGFGKTTAAGAECQAWCTHSNRWRHTPDWPVQVVWFCQDYQQFGKIREQIEAEIIGSTARWRATDDGKFYEYPDGSRWFVASADRSWTFFQGTNPDLIVFDEQPPLPLWREAMMRRRGKRKTRFVVSATATQGMTWMADLIWRPWKDYYEAKGMSHETALIEQPHPDIWCWDTGGIANNPGADAEDLRWYQNQKFASEKEKQVRLYGGFQDWTGDPVFEDLDMDRIRAEIERWEKAGGKPVHGILEPIFNRPEGPGA